MSAISYSLDSVVYIIILAQKQKLRQIPIQLSSIATGKSMDTNYDRHRCVIHDRDSYDIVFIHGIPFLFLKC